MTIIVPEEINFDINGKFISYLKIPYSTNSSGWGSLMMPLIVIRNGKGKKILFTGGNHGDEYEGPIALRNLANELKQEDIQGQVIIVPYLNFPAVLAGRRLSPVDGLNMNRSFPGDPQGTMTMMIADFVFQHLVQRSDVVIDLHSGGSSMIFEPCVVIHHLENLQQMKETISASRSFGAPISLVVRELDSSGMLDTVVEESGKIFISTELGGGGFVSPRTLIIAENGIRSILRYFNIIPNFDKTVPETRFMETPEIGGYLMSPNEGLFQPLIELGEHVNEGQIVGLLHSLTEIDSPALEITSKIEGILVMRAGRTHVKHWDTIAVIASDFDVSVFE
tara:strand:- start:92 stop:1099 length:1008 start_codon:yes stop_codon:yes gene_type:complete